MNKFDIGDRVYYRQRPDHERTVTAIHLSGAIDVKSDDGKTYSRMPASSYILITPFNPTEQAVRLLTRAGYTVTPPPAPLSGEVVMIMTPSGNVHAIPKDRYDKANYSLTVVRVIAVVPWTEGMGLEDKPKDGSF